MEREGSFDAAGDAAGEGAEAPVLVTTVDIGENQSDQIELRQGDDPEDAAAAFCAKHGLTDEVRGPLAAHIADNLARAVVSSGDTPANSADGGSADAGVREPSGEYEQLQRQHQQPQEDEDEFAEQRQQQQGLEWHAGRLRDSLFSDEGSFVGAEPLPEAAALPAEGRQPYTAPPSPTKRGAGTTGTGSRREPVAAAPPAAAEADRAREATAAAVAEERLWGESYVPGRAQQTRRVCERLYGHGRQREQKLQAERRLRDEAAKTMRSSYTLAISARSRQLAAGRCDPGEYANHGERMYVEGVMEQRRKEQATLDAAAAREAAELEGLTLRPRISSMARQLRNPGGDRDRLARPRTDKTQERLATLAREREEVSVADCTFRPAINTRSERLMADRSTVLREHRISAHDQLYQDAHRRAARASEYEHWYPEQVTFRPAVNPARRRSRSADADEEKPVQERLYAVAKQTADKLEARRSAAPVDAATGRALFAPATGRAPQQPRNRARAPVGDYLYRISREHADKKEVLHALSDEQRRADATATYTTSASKAMVGKLKAKRFRQIFDYLDAAGAGDLDMVTLLQAFGKDKTLMDTLDAEVRADVEAAARLASKRVAAGAAPHNENAPPEAAAAAAASSPASVAAAAAPLTVGLPDFAALMEEVLARSHHPRAYLLPSQRSRKKWEEPTFKPATNQRSMALAQRQRPAGQKGYDILYSTAAVAENRRSERRQAATAAEMQACTFKPALAPPRRRSSATGASRPDPGSAASTPAPPTTAAAVPAATLPLETPGSDADIGFANPGDAALASAATGERRPPSAASTRASVAMSAAAHRSLDHEKYTSLDAQVRAAMEETAALAGLGPAGFGRDRAPQTLAGLAA